MNEGNGLLGTLQTGMAGLTDFFFLYLPQLLGALLVLLAGWLLAALLRVLTIRAVQGLDWFLPRVLPGHLGLHLHKVLHPKLFGSIVYWVVLLAFVASATQVLGLSVFSSWLDALVSRLPLIVIAGLVVISSIIISQLVREAIVRTAETIGLEYRRLLGYAGQVAILIMAAVIALDLVGLDITFLVVLASILVGALCGGGALAFGLGSRTLVSNLLGVRSMRDRFKIGDAIRIGELEGRVTGMDRRMVILSTEDGQVSVPGHLFNEQPCLLLTSEDERG